MKTLVITEIDLDTGQYEITFRNKSNPGRAMDLQKVRAAFLQVAKQFAAGQSKKDPNPGAALA